MSKVKINPIVGRQVRLRLIEEADLATTLGWRNQPRVRRCFKHSLPLSPAQHQEWFQNYLKDGNDYLFIVEEIARQNQPIGQVGLYRIDRSARQAEFGRLLIGPSDALGHGHAFEASRILLDFGLKELDLDRIYLEVKDENTRAIRLYERLGFTASSSSNGLTLMDVKLTLPATN